MGDKNAEEGTTLNGMMTLNHHPKPMMVSTTCYTLSLLVILCFQSQELIHAAGVRESGVCLGKNQKNVKEPSVKKGTAGHPILPLEGGGMVLANEDYDVQYSKALSFDSNHLDESYCA